MVECKKLASQFQSHNVHVAFDQGSLESVEIFVFLEQSNCIGIPKYECFSGHRTPVNPSLPVAWSVFRKNLQSS